jgi:hypothetical protein
MSGSAAAAPRRRAEELGDQPAVGADLDAPADRGIGVGEHLDHLEMLRAGHLRTALGARAAHAEEPVGAQLGDEIGGKAAQRLDFLRASAIAGASVRALARICAAVSEPADAPSELTAVAIALSPGRYHCAPV